MSRRWTVIQRCPATGLLVGWHPGIPGAHSQGETLAELRGNLAEVLQMLAEDDAEPTLPASSRSTLPSPTTDGNGASPFTSH